MSIFDLIKNPSLLQTLRNDIVMVGLNFSRPLLPLEPFKNFHDSSPHANDFKIRYAFRNTPFYGAYMTDIIKNLVLKSSHEIGPHLKKHPNVIRESISSFREELSDLEANRPMLLAFGVEAHGLLFQHLARSEYSRLVRLTHYSHQISKEDYKREVMRQISNTAEY